MEGLNLNRKLGRRSQGKPRGKTEATRNEERFANSPGVPCPAGQCGRSQEPCVSHPGQALPSPLFAARGGQMTKSSQGEGSSLCVQSHLPSFCWLEPRCDGWSLGSHPDHRRKPCGARGAWEWRGSKTGAQDPDGSGADTGSTDHLAAGFGLEGKYQPVLRVTSDQGFLPPHSWLDVRPMLFER